MAADTDITTIDAGPRKLHSALSRPAHDLDATENKRRVQVARQAYGRGRKMSVRGIKDKKLRSNLKTLEEKYKDATLKAKDAEILLENESGYLEPEGELEKTYKVRQDELRKETAVETAKKGFELNLEALGPYLVDYTRNGRCLLLAGRKGHVSTMDWRAGKLGCELQLQETVRDAIWLHNDQYFAVAQKKYVYIYDQAGIELHCLKKHIEVTNMQFLPYHFLLATVVSRIFSYYGCSLTRIGHGWISQIHRYLYGSDGHRATIQARFTYFTDPKPTKCNPTHGPPQWDSYPLVT